jgi:hypothetical protein
MLLYWLTFWLISGSPDVHQKGPWLASLVIIVIVEVLVDLVNAITADR